MDWVHISFLGRVNVVTPVRCFSRTRSPISPPYDGFFRTRVNMVINYHISVRSGLISRWNGLIYTIPLLEVAHFPSIQGGSVVRHFPSVRRVFRKRGRWLINSILPAEVVNFPSLRGGVQIDYIFLLEVVHFQGES